MNGKSYSAAPRSQVGLEDAMCSAVYPDASDSLKYRMFERARLFLRFPHAKHAAERKRRVPALVQCKLLILVIYPFALTYGDFKKRIQEDLSVPSQSVTQLCDI